MHGDLVPQDLPWASHKLNLALAQGPDLPKYLTAYDKIILSLP